MKFIKSLMLTVGLLCVSTTLNAYPNHNAVEADKHMQGVQGIVSMFLIENNSCNIKISVNGETRWQHGCDTTNFTIMRNDKAMVQFYNGEKPPYAFGMHIDNVDLSSGISKFTITDVYAGKGHSIAHGKCINNMNTNSFVCKSHLQDGQNNVDMEFSTSGGKKTIINNN